MPRGNRVGEEAQGELIRTLQRINLKPTQTKAKLKRHIENIWKIRGKPRKISAKKTGKFDTQTHLAEGEIERGKFRAHVKGRNSARNTHSITPRVSGVWHQYKRTSASPHQIRKVFPVRQTPKEKPKVST